MEFLAHISDDGRKQTVQEHLEGTARLCSEFAAEFDAAEQGYLAGISHDIGKYTEAFQRRLRGGPKVDHATAGAMECAKAGFGQAAVCERALKGSQDSEAAFARFVLAMASPNAAR